MTSEQIQKEESLHILIQRLHYPSPADPVRKQERRLLRRKIARIQLAQENEEVEAQK